MPVFTVPGIYLILPSRRGKVRCTPLFLDKQHVDRIAAYVQDVLIHTVSQSLSSCSCCASMDSRSCHAKPLCNA